MDEISMNLKNRNDLLVSVPFTADFKKMVAEIEQKYPGFKVQTPEIEPLRMRWINGSDHYEFYLVRA